MRGPGRSREFCRSSLPRVGANFTTLAQHHWTVHNALSFGVALPESGSFRSESPTVIQGRWGFGGPHPVLPTPCKVCVCVCAPCSPPASCCVTPSCFTHNPGQSEHITEPGPAPLLTPAEGPFALPHRMTPGPSPPHKHSAGPSSPVHRGSGPPAPPAPRPPAPLAPGPPAPPAPGPPAPPAPGPPAPPAPRPPAPPAPRPPALPAPGPPAPRPDTVGRRGAGGPGVRPAPHTISRGMKRL